MTLPPLPEIMWLADGILGFTNKQMSEYGAACRTAALEECARKFETEYDDGDDFAAAIRALIK